DVAPGRVGQGREHPGEPIRRHAFLHVLNHPVEHNLTSTGAVVNQLVEDIVTPSGAELVQPRADLAGPPTRIFGLVLDHLVYATGEVAATVADLEGKLGVRATPGGRHAGLGTHNALLDLGQHSYLEIIGPDPS